MMDQERSGLYDKETRNMPAVHYKSKRLYDLIEAMVAHNPTAEMLDLQLEVLDLMHGFNIGLAAMKGGASGVRFRQLVQDYEATRAFIETQKRRPGTPAAAP